MDGRKKLCGLSSFVPVIWQTAYSQVGVILLGAFIGFLLYKREKADEEGMLPFPLSRRFAIGCLVLFFGLLFLLPILRELTSIQWIALFDSFYRSAALVFGGGHVVLPLLEREFVTDWLVE